MDKERLISEILLLPQKAIEYHLSKQLAELFPAKALIECENMGSFDMQVSILHEQMVSANSMPEPEQINEQHAMHSMGMSRMIRQGRFRGGM